MQRKVPESRHMHSFPLQVEVGVDSQEDVAVVVDLETITRTSKIRIMQKMQVVEEEEEIKEQGGALEAEVDGNKETTVIQMDVGFVAKQGTMHMSAIITGQMTEGTTSHNKEIMHLHQTKKVMGIYLLCNPC